MKGFDERKYYLTAKFILLKAVEELYPEYCVIVKNSLNNGKYAVINGKKQVTWNEVKNIKEKMDEIIRRAIPIRRVLFDPNDISKETIEGIREDLREIIFTTGIIAFYIYDLDGYRSYLIEEIYENTSYIYEYDIYPYDEGFIFKVPFKMDGEVKMPPMIDDKKMAKVFNESSKWNEIMGVSCLGSLNRLNLEGQIVQLIRVNETLHQKKISRISDIIVENEKIKIVTIAGPSSSGKTTFGYRLSLHLMALGKSPLVISLDNYYVDREFIPKDSEGNKDFESLAALDLPLLNSNLKSLLEGQETEIPRYNFKTGKREQGRDKIKLHPEGIIILEGIHGLNEKLLQKISKECIYKVYISCLTQLNIDSHNRIQTSEVRKLRRIVRDMISRNFNAEETLEMWERVRTGEGKNIFPYQENADIIFDTSLTYEIGVLRPFAERELIKVGMDSPHYQEARKLLRFLSYFLPIPDKYVPDESILKEFIGGSYFYSY